MDGLVAYILAKKLVAGAISGVTKTTLVDGQLLFEFNDGTSASMTIPIPKDGKDGEDGVSVKSLYIDDNENLICTLSDGTEIQAGKLPSSSSSIVFVEDSSKLPLQGQTDTLYVAGTAIYLWSGTNYVELSSGGGGGGSSIQWGVF